MLAVTGGLDSVIYTLNQNTKCSCRHYHFLRLVGRGGVVGEVGVRHWGRTWRSAPLSARSPLLATYLYHPTLEEQLVVYVGP